MTHPPANPLRTQRRPRALLCSVVVLAGTWTGAAVADDVHLVNGAVFEDVSTERTDTHVLIEMPIGRLRLPAEQVARIVDGDSPIATYRRRSNALLSDPSSGAADFLDLARWAVRQGLSGQARQAALIAARFDPDLGGLTELLTGLGYEKVAGIGWLPYAEAQRSRGLVLLDGEWLTRREREARIARELRDAQRAAPTARSTDGGDRELARESVELARRAVESADASRRSAEDRSAERGRNATRSSFDRHGPRFGGQRANVYGGVVLPVQRVDPEAAAAYQERVRKDLAALATRTPGSLIPVQEFRPPK